MLDRYKHVPTTQVPDKRQKPIPLVDTGVAASLVSSKILDTLECIENLKQVTNNVTFSKAGIHIPLIPIDREDEDLRQQDYRNLESFTQLDFNNETKQIAKIAEKVEQALNVSDNIRTKIEILLKKHEGLFADQESDLGLATQVKHHINIGYNAPINQRLRRTPESLKLVVKTKIE
ncbi:hypothetical protein OUZ56_033661 [Daphnia magna]|uniref:Uncharacterized protein n=1 Tax=Daphnia magna TaxID=35525 RepID=A0ABR0BBA6_9CRUS|nr:hypothetical protein OUZ56_033661 [Daphnia magna]